MIARETVQSVKQVLQVVSIVTSFIDMPLALQQWSHGAYKRSQESAAGAYQVC